MNNIRTTVLACIDGSTFSESVVDYAAWASRTVQNPLKLLHNIEHRQTPRSNLSGNIGLGTRESLLEELTELEAKSNKLLMEQGKVMLEEARERALRQEAVNPTSLQRHGTLADSLVEMEEEIRVLVMGVRGEDHEDNQNQIGAQLETVIRNMHRPVLVVNRPFSEPPKRIMLAYDDSDQARKALDMVATSPLYKGMHCSLVHVAKESKDEADFLEAAATTLSDTGLEVETQTLLGDVETALLDYQRDKAIDMTVMGAFGHSRLRELLFGSVTAKMLSRSRVPLLLLR